MEPRLSLETTNEPIDLPPMEKWPTYNSVAIIQSPMTQAILNGASAPIGDYKRICRIFNYEEFITNYNTISNDPGHTPDGASTFARDIISQVTPSSGNPQLQLQYNL